MNAQRKLNTVLDLAIELIRESDDARALEKPAPLDYEIYAILAQAIKSLDRHFLQSATKSAGPRYY